LLGPLAPELAQQAGAAYPAVVKAAAGVLPCLLCPRYSRVVVAGLARVRLGQHQRRILLEAAPPDADRPATVRPEREGRSGEEAQRRALRCLQRVGLIQRGHEWRVWLTPQGSAVVAAIGGTLRRGQPVRWPRARAAILTGLETPTEALWARFAARVERERRLASEAASMVGMFAAAAHGVSAEQQWQAAQRHAARADHFTQVATALGPAGAWQA
jgi:hypothetical protein